MSHDQLKGSGHENCLSDDAFPVLSHLAYGVAENNQEPSQSNIICDTCYSVKGELVKTTKFSLLSSGKKYTIIEMKNGDVYVHDGDLILGPVGLEIEIVASPGLDRFPPELRSVYSHATTATIMSNLWFHLCIPYHITC